MLKGIAKQIMVYSDCNDTLFEQVIFIVRRDAELKKQSDSDISSAAQRIIDACSASGFVCQSTASDTMEKNKTSQKSARFAQTNIDGDVLIGIPKTHTGKHYAHSFGPRKKRRLKRDILLKGVFVLAIAAFCFSLSMLLFF